MRLAAGLLLFVAVSHGQWRVMPLPYSIRAGGEPMAVGSGLHVQVEGADALVERAAQRLRERVSRLRPGVSAHAALVVRTQALPGDESYRLVVEGPQATLTAPGQRGVLHGLETFYQLIEKTPAGWRVPGVVIDDRPRFGWRGLLLDVSRHFMPPDLIRRTLDGMAAVKLNVFHWHLSDDQGFRIESKLFPRLHELGGDGDYYTQDQVRDLIDYARDRGIRIVPEFDMPGHATSWLVGYPEFGVGPGPFEIVRTWGGFHGALDPGKPGIYRFLDGFIGEMASLFPDPWFHIGGDEVKMPRGPRMEFNGQIHRILAKYGKRMAGWDEILSPELPKDVMIQSWRGTRQMAIAARLGYAGTLSAGYYLDLPDAASKMYLADPAAPKVSGGEACMWTEYASPGNVESRIWPRAAAVAERLWSPAAVRDVADMYRRLSIVDGELDELGLRHNAGYRVMLERLAGSSDTDALRVLADVLEPGGLGVRLRGNRNYTQNTPLDRLVDTVRPDSAVARRFSQLVDQHLAKPTDTAVHEEIRRWLTLWAENDAKLRPLLNSRPILREAVPVSAALAEMAKQALAGRKGSPSTSSAEVTLAVAGAIERLVSGPVKR